MMEMIQGKQMVVQAEKGGELMQIAMTEEDDGWWWGETEGRL